MASTIDFGASLEEIISAASNAGADTNLYYITTLERYKMQLTMLEKLKRSIADDGMIIYKETASGRTTAVANPAVAEYNRTASAANQTVQTLMKIVRNPNSASITKRFKHSQKS